MVQNQNQLANKKITTKKHLSGFWGAKVVEAFIAYNEKKAKEPIMERE